MNFFFELSIVSGLSNGVDVHNIVDGGLCGSGLLGVCSDHLWVGFLPLFKGFVLWKSVALNTEMVSLQVNTSFTIGFGLVLWVVFFCSVGVFTWDCSAFVCGMPTLLASQSFVLGMRTAIVVSISRVVDLTFRLLRGLGLEVVCCFRIV